MTNSPLLDEKRKTTRTARNLKIPREQIIVRAGVVTILTNILLAGFKIAVGVISNSLAIISDATHGLIDSVSGIVIIVGEKLAAHERLAKNRHRIERITTLVIAGIIIIVGAHILIESVEKIIEPEPVDYTLPTMIVLVASVVAKLLLGLYLRRRGNEVKSDTLKASSTEALNDFIISLAVLGSAAIYLIWGADIEAYVSILIAFLIIKFGLEYIFPQAFYHHHVHHGQPHHGKEPGHERHHR